MVSSKFYKSVFISIALLSFFSLLYQEIIETKFELNLRAVSSMTDYKIPSQEWLKEQLNLFYDELYSTYQPPPDWIHISVNQTYYFPNINIIFTGIPKTGCSHWKELFLQAEGVLQGRLEYLPDVHRELSFPYRLPNFAKIWNGKYDEKINTATSIVALRNPWVRAVSGYRQKLSSEKTQGNILPKLQLAILQSERDIAHIPLKKLVRLIETGKESPTFEEYVRCTVKGHEDIMTDPHFMPQHMFLSVNKVRYDYILPMEYAEQMSTQFFKKVGIDISLPGSYDRETDPRLQTSVVKARELFTALDKELVDEFYEIYKWDFKLLGYSNFSDPNFPFPNSYSDSENDK